MDLIALDLSQDITVESKMELCQFAPDINYTVFAGPLLYYNVNASSLPFQVFIWICSMISQ